MPDTPSKPLFQPIDCEKIAASAPVRGKLYCFNRLDSTNTWLQKNGKCGDICISNKQTAGRGRRGNRWHSPATGNIYFSLLWCFDSPVQELKHFSLLGLSVAIAMAEALSDIGLQGHGVKWPNDIYWQKKKMAGILVENIHASNKLIIGIGINVNMPENEASRVDQAITCLRDALKQQTKDVGSKLHHQLLTAMIQRLNQHLGKFASLSLDNFMDDWNHWDMLKGRAISFQHQNKKVTGTVAGLDQHGRLALLDTNKKLQYYASADIRLRSLDE